MLKRTFAPAFISLPVSSGKDVAVLADGVFVQERLGLLLAHVVLPDELFVVGDVLNQVRQQVVHHRARAGTRLGLDRLDVAIFGEAAVGDVVDPHVRTGCRNDVRLRNLDDQIGLADVPDVVVGERPRRRHVAMSPFCAPWSTHAAIVAISCSVSDGSSLNF